MHRIVVSNFLEFRLEKGVLLFNVYLFCSVCRYVVLKIFLNTLVYGSILWGSLTIYFCIRKYVIVTVATLGY